MNLIYFDKAYNEYEHFMRRVKGHLSMPSKLHLRLWEEWKIENGYEKKPIVKKNIVKG